jgi:hypothetical protein
MKPKSADSRKPERTFDMMKMCPEAQADGVPCPELGRSCEICERALRPDDGDDPPGKPGPPVAR